MHSVCHKLIFSATYTGILRTVNFCPIGNEAFALKAYIIRPYTLNLEKEQRDYNFHLSRARLVENRFKCTKL